MTTATATKTATREWMSVYEKHQIKLIPLEEIIDSQHGKRVVPGSGRILRFEKFRCQLTPDDEALLQEHHPDLVVSGKVAPTDRFTGIPGQATSGPTVISGAQATRTAASNTAPRPGWDEATTREIQEWIDTRQVGDLEMARQYEMTHRRRKMVVRLITDAQLGDDPEPEPDPEPIAASYSAPIPEDL